MSLENPFQDPLRFERRVPECAMVIFGANGDLTKRKLLPALYRLAYERRLDAGFAVLGISRTPMSDDQFREKMLASVKEFLEDSPFDADVWTAFAQGLFYMAGDIDNPAVFPALDARLKEIEAARHTGGNVLFYLSTQPSQYIPAAQGLGAANVGKGAGWRRIVIEKPFGHDLASARWPDRHRKAFRPRSGQPAEIERRTAQSLRRIRGLPHRSLPRQRNRAEHPGISLRQRHLRAAVESPLRESRADHRCRIHRRGKPWRLLPGSRRPARHDPESPVAGDGHYRHGA